jgi:hypothetical protein
MAGLAAGLALCAARLSGGLTLPALADALQVSESTISAWEDGTEPLACIPVDAVDFIKTALLAANADPELIADIDPATWCDVILMAMDSGEDTSCLLADPLAAAPGSHSYSTGLPAAKFLPDTAHTSQLKQNPPAARYQIRASLNSRLMTQHDMPLNSYLL